MFHDVLSVKKGIKPVQDQRAEHQADEDSEENLFHDVGP